MFYTKSPNMSRANMVFSKKSTKKVKPFPEQAVRLSAIRTKTGLKRPRFAAKIHASSPQYAMWERGEIQIPAWAEANIEREFLQKESPPDGQGTRHVTSLDERRDRIIDRVIKLLERGDPSIEATLANIADLLESQTPKPPPPGSRTGRRSDPR